jgi:hypothetical protein
MMRQRRAHAVVAAALAFGGAAVLMGCGVPPPKSQFPTASHALDRMKENYACANGMQGEAKIDHFGPRGRIRGTVQLFAVNPARVRIDVLSPLNTTVYTLTSNGRDFQMLDVQGKKFLYGPAKPCNLARMTQVPVPGHVLVWLLRGEAPLLKHDRNGPTIKWDESGHYQVDIGSVNQANQRVHLEVHPDDFDKPYAQQRLRVTRVLTTQLGVTFYDAELNRHEPAKTRPARVDPDGLSQPIPPSGGACSAEIPRSIRITVPSSGDDVIFQHKWVGFNPPIPAGAFSQVVPDGVRKQFVNCD